MSWLRDYFLIRKKGFWLLKIIQIIKNHISFGKQTLYEMLDGQIT